MWFRSSASLHTRVSQSGVPSTVLALGHSSNLERAALEAGIDEDRILLQVCSDGISGRRQEADRRSCMQTRVTGRVCQQAAADGHFQLDVVLSQPLAFHSGLPTAQNVWTLQSYLQSTAKQQRQHRSNFIATHSNFAVPMMSSFVSTAPAHPCWCTPEIDVIAAFH